MMSRFKNGTLTIPTTEPRGYLLSHATMELQIVWHAGNRHPSEGRTKEQVNDPPADGLGDVGIDIGEIRKHVSLEELQYRLSALSTFQRPLRIHSQVKQSIDRFLPSKATNGPCQSELGTSKTPARYLDTLTKDVFNPQASNCRRAEFGNELHDQHLNCLYLLSTDSPACETWRPRYEREAMCSTGRANCPKVSDKTTSRNLSKGVHGSTQPLTRCSSAIKCYEEAASLAPNDPASVSNLSAAKFEMGKYRDAAELAQKALTSRRPELSYICA